MSRRILTPVLIVGGVVAGGTLLARQLGYQLGTNVVVRCRQGHVYSTVWIPGVKLKGVDLVVARLQHCPVGQHWSLAVPVRDGDLTDGDPAGGDLEFAQEHHDVPIP
jgi:hypothetical protein